MEHLPMRTSVTFSMAAALAAMVVVSADQASAKSRGGGRDNAPKSVSVRDHRTPKVVTVRDHREPKVVNVRDHRTTKTENPKFIWVEKKGQSGHWERARAEVKSTPV